MKKIPIFLVTGFLGSGKTSFISHFLHQYDQKKKIAIVQNEFAPLNIDSVLLQKDSDHFHLEELHTGSIFCACLFPRFRELLLTLSDKSIEAVLVETTGIADPIAIAQLVEDEQLSKRFYMAQVITLVDAPRVLAILLHIQGVRHQVQIADTLLINKVDLIEEETLHTIKEQLQAINPYAEVIAVTQAQVDFDQTMNWEAQHKAVFEQQNIKGELTRCGDGGYVSSVYKTTKRIRKVALQTFLAALDENILRVKGYLCLESGEKMILQYLPQQMEQIPYSSSMGQTELIAIGYKKPPFYLLEE